MTKSKKEKNGKKNKKGTNFKPTPKMLKWLESALKPDVSPLITEISRDSGVPRKNWYKWIKRPEFMEWWGNEWHLGMSRAEYFLDKVGLQKATKDFRYWEAMQMKFHKYAQKKDITTGGKPIEHVNPFTKLSESEKIDLADKLGIDLSGQ